MDMPVKVDMGMEPMEAKLVLSGIDRDSLKLFGLSAGSFTPVTLRGATQNDNTGEIESAVIHMRGQCTKVTWGTWKPGEKAPPELMFSPRYYKLEIAGETIHEIDIENMVRIIDGTDQLAKMREALGI